MATRTYAPELGQDIQQGLSNLGSLFGPPTPQALLAKQAIASQQLAAQQRKDALAGVTAQYGTGVGALYATGDNDAIKHDALRQQYVNSQVDAPNITKLDLGNYALNGDAKNTFLGQQAAPLNADQSRILPPAIAGALGVPAQQHGVISLGSDNKMLPGSGSTSIVSAPDDGQPGSTDELAVKTILNFQKTHPQGGNPNDDPVVAAALGRLQGAKGVTVNTGDNTSVDAAANKAYGGVLGKDVIGADVERGAGSGRLRQDVATMRSAISSGGDNIAFGPGANLILQAKRAGNSLLGLDLKGVPESDVINNVGYGLATAAAKGISSRPTQAEFARALETKPGLAMSKQGSLALLDIMDQHARDDEAIAQLANDPKARQNWIAAKQQYYATHPIMSPFTPGKPFGADDIATMTRAADASAGGGAPAAGAAPSGDMPTLSDPSQVAKLPSGTKFKTPDGRVGTAP